MGSVLPKQEKGIDLPTFTIMVEGEDVSAKYGFVSLSVARAVNRISVAKVVLNDGDVSKRDFERSNMEIFAPGKKVTIKGGYHRDEDIIFAGIIVKHAIRAPHTGTSSLTIEMRHEAVKLTVGRKNKSFAKKKDKDVISSILGEAGVSGTVDATDVEHEDLVQYYVSNWDFILSRADVNGLLVFLDDKGIKIKKPDTSSSPVFKLEYGRHIVDFEAEMDARDQYEDVKTVGWDYSKQETVEGKAKPPSGKEEGNIDGKKLSETIGVKKYLMQHPGLTKKEELDTWATSKLMRSRLSKIMGRVRVHGTPGVKPGDVVELAGLGNRFNGNVFVSAVSNTYSVKSVWYTDIFFGFSQNWFTDLFDVTDKPAAGLLPAMNGLHVGTVTKIDDADGGEFRVRVKLPLIDGSNEDVWARVATLDAGDSYGVVVRPKKGNEVVMGFVNDDPRDAVILGVLHSKKNKTPKDLEAKKADKKYGWFTKGEIKLYIDDEKKIVLVETPAKNTLIIDDDKKSITLMDQHKNKIIMDDKGILIETPKDLVMKATGDVKMEGKNITEKAQMQYKASGSSGAELSSSGQAVLKGSIVKIN